jgi:hypothetical protein
MLQAHRARTLCSDRERRDGDQLQEQRNQARTEECLRAYREEAAGRLILAMLGRRHGPAE